MLRLLFDGCRAKKLFWCLDFKDSSVLFVHTKGEHVYIELFIHIPTVETEMISDIIPVGNSSRSPHRVCAERGMLSHSFPPFMRQIPLPSIYLFISARDGWSLTFPTEATHVAPQPVCHYRWPHLDLPVISRPPCRGSQQHAPQWGSVRGGRERGDRKGVKTRGEWWMERWEGRREGGKWNEVVGKGERGRTKAGAKRREWGEAEAKKK